MEKSEGKTLVLKALIELVVAGLLGKLLTWLATRDVFAPKKNLDAWGVVLQGKTQPNIWIIAILVVIIVCAQEFFLMNDRTVNDKELMPFEKYRKLAIGLRIGISVVGMIVELISRPMTNGHILLSILVGLIIYFFIGLFEKVNWLFGETVFHPILSVVTVLITSVGLFLIINACIIPILMAISGIFLIMLAVGALSKMPTGDYGFVGIMGLGNFFYYKYY